MILGLGCDLVDSRRIEALIDRYGSRFLHRIYTPLEQERGASRVHASLAFASIFAAKEAAMKAIGDLRGIHWHDFEIQKNGQGKPLLLLRGRALKNLLVQYPGYGVRALVTLSDEPPYAQAVVVLEGTPT
jgi:holo-[acyl-carrier protein] synthase